jgi:protein-S-isoprenylcysteine O-methyltransferase Ste14
MQLKLFLPIFLLVYFIAAFFWRSFVVWKRTGINPVVFKGSDNAHDFIGRVFKLLFALVVVIVLVHSVSEVAYQYLKPIRLLEREWIRMTGAVLLLLSLAWTILAQSQMGDSWRIGIDSEHRTRLVRSGVFSLSRNPIFVGMMITLLGLFLVIPNVVTLLTLMLGVVLINVQVRLEEEHLSRLHAEEYEEYRQRVRRWV